MRVHGHIVRACGYVCVHTCVCVIKIEFVTQDADVWSCLRSRRVSGLCKCFCSSAPDRQQHLLTAVTNSVAVTLKVVHAKQLLFFLFFFLRTVPIYISLNPTQSCSVKVPGTVFHYWIPICMWEHKRVKCGPGEGPRGVAWRAEDSQLTNGTACHCSGNLQCSSSTVV